ncbi:Inner centromere protein-related protein pic1 [Porphyridium purpureum]|uniref:Inner centromere protein-related protein pic1 n=1 Tax=Porphyridium purpureum TaxID=35688 RepID=A0A5J4YPP1_PORPP|nr:Inner centromere protein-related protein pic1 [Porphyridium purpureum]|eukprot:POR2642..scf295_9
MEAGGGQVDEIVAVLREVADARREDVDESFALHRQWTMDSVLGTSSALAAELNIDLVRLRDTLNARGAFAKNKYVRQFLDTHRMISAAGGEGTHQPSTPGGQKNENTDGLSSARRPARSPQEIPPTSRIESSETSAQGEIFGLQAPPTGKRSVSMRMRARSTERKAVKSKRTLPSRCRTGKALPEDKENEQNVLSSHIDVDDKSYQPAVKMSPTRATRVTRATRRKALGTLDCNVQDMHAKGTVDVAKSLERDGRRQFQQRASQDENEQHGSVKRQKTDETSMLRPEETLNEATQETFVPSRRDAYEIDQQIVDETENQGEEATPHSQHVVEETADALLVEAVQEPEARLAPSIDDTVSAETLKDDASPSQQDTENNLDDTEPCAAGKQESSVAILNKQDATQSKTASPVAERMDSDEEFADACSPAKDQDHEGRLSDAAEDGQRSDSLGAATSLQAWEKATDDALQKSHSVARLAQPLDQDQTSKCETENEEKSAGGVLSVAPTQNQATEQARNDVSRRQAQAADAPEKTMGKARGKRAKKIMATKSRPSREPSDEHIRTLHHNLPNESVTEEVLRHLTEVCPETSPKRRTGENEDEPPMKKLRSARSRRAATANPTLHRTTARTRSWKPKEHFAEVGMEPKHSTDADELDIREEPHANEDEQTDWHEGGCSPRAAGAETNRAKETPKQSPGEVAQLLPRHANSKTRASLASEDHDSVPASPEKVDASTAEFEHPEFLLAKAAGSEDVYDSAALDDCKEAQAAAAILTISKEYIVSTEANGVFVVYLPADVTACIVTDCAKSYSSHYTLRRHIKEKHEKLIRLSKVPKLAPPCAKESGRETNSSSAAKKTESTANIVEQQSQDDSRAAEFNSSVTLVDENSEHGTMAPGEEASDGEQIRKLVCASSKNAPEQRPDSSKREEGRVFHLNKFENRQECDEKTATQVLSLEHSQIPTTGTEQDPAGFDEMQEDLFAVLVGAETLSNVSMDGSHAGRGIQKDMEGTQLESAEAVGRESSSDDRMLEPQTDMEVHVAAEDTLSADIEVPAIIGSCGTHSPDSQYVERDRTTENVVLDDIEAGEGRESSGSREQEKVHETMFEETLNTMLTDLFVPASAPSSAPGTPLNIASGLESLTRLPTKRASESGPTMRLPPVSQSPVPDTEAQVVEVDQNHGTSGFYTPSKQSPAYDREAARKSPAIASVENVERLADCTSADHSSARVFEDAADQTDAPKNEQTSPEPTTTRESSLNQLQVPAKGGGETSAHLTPVRADNSVDIGHSPEDAGTRSQQSNTPVSGPFAVSAERPPRPPRAASAATKGMVLTFKRESSATSNLSPGGCDAVKHSQRLDGYSTSPSSGGREKSARIGDLRSKIAKLRSTNSKAKPEALKSRLPVHCRSREEADSVALEHETARDEIPKHEAAYEEPVGHDQTASNALSPSSGRIKPAQDQVAAEESCHIEEGESTHISGLVQAPTNLEDAANAKLTSEEIQEPEIPAKPWAPTNIVSAFTSFLPSVLRKEKGVEVKEPDAEEKARALQDQLERRERELQSRRKEVALAKQREQEERQRRAEAKRLALVAEEKRKEAERLAREEERMQKKQKEVELRRKRARDEEEQKREERRRRIEENQRRVEEERAKRTMHLNAKVLTKAAHTSALTPAGYATASSSGSRPMVPGLNATFAASGATGSKKGLDESEMVVSASAQPRVFGVAGASGSSSVSSVRDVVVPKTPPALIKPAAHEPNPESYDMTAERNEGYSDTDNESGDDSTGRRGRPKKPIPGWAKGDQLLEALERQRFVDPDSIFPRMYTCNLEEVFAAVKEKKKRYRARTSTGNWVRDRLTWQEEMEYKKKMGLL